MQTVNRILNIYQVERGVLIVSANEDGRLGVCLDSTYVSLAYGSDNTSLSTIFCTSHFHWTLYHIILAGCEASFDSYLAVQ
jgi:hypothetical protein